LPFASRGFTGSSLEPPPAAPQGQGQVEEIEVFTSEELVVLLEVARTDWPEYHPFLLSLSRTVTITGKALVAPRRVVPRRYEPEAGRRPPKLADAPRGRGGDRGPIVHRAWRQILKRAGPRYRKIHKLHHTVASLLIVAGQPINYFRAQLGNHSAAFTWTVYGHLIPRANHGRVRPARHATVRNLRATARTATRPARR
jgi:integrase